MPRKQSYLKLGVFVFIGTLLFIAAIFLIGDKAGMFEDKFRLKARFGNIEGLREGASVRMSGINIGTIEQINIVADTSANVEVVMELKAAVSRLMTEGTKATIETEGLIGNKVLTLEPGPQTNPKLEEDAVIKGVDPLGLGVILKEVGMILNDTREMTQSLSDIITKINTGDGTISKLINDDDLYEESVKFIRTAEMTLGELTIKLDTLTYVVTSLGTQTQSIVENVNDAASNIDTIIAGIKRGEGVLGKALAEDSELSASVSMMIDNFIKISEEVKMGTERFAENMEALKRNWLFSSYFEQRGYYDKTGYEKSLDEYIEEIDEKLKMLNNRIIQLQELKNEKK